MGVLAASWCTEMGCAQLSSSTDDGFNGLMPLFLQVCCQPGGSHDPSPTSPPCIGMQCTRDRHERDAVTG
jgi:hypothetical protein